MFRAVRANEPGATPTVRWKAALKALADW